LTASNASFTDLELAQSIQIAHTCPDFSISIMSSTIFVSFSAMPKRARHVSSNFRSSVGAGILLVTVRKYPWALRDTAGWKSLDRMIASPKP
jgi:hypothetical protein